MKGSKDKSSTKAQKEPVRLREKVLSNGSISLYLDIYRNGRREYEFLKLYLIKAKTPMEKEQNRQTLATAQAIKAKRQIEIQNGEYDFTTQFKTDTPFLQYYRKLCEERHGNEESRGNWGNWFSCLKHLERYCDEHTTFKEITPDWIQGFKDYLDNAGKNEYKRRNNLNAEVKPLSQNSKVSYFNKLRACINQAFDDRIIPVNPLRGIEGFKAEEVERVYLTFDEVQRLAATDCRYPVMKRAFLFSCLTGIRKSDIEKMVWSEVQSFGDFTRITFKQKKTGGQEYLDINKQAADYMGERSEPTERVFAGFSYSSQTLLELKRWCMKAGIMKEVTFHSGRHTFAVMMLDLGADIYTVSKLLGHKELQTTQVYAKVLDSKKQAAVNLIPDLKIEK
ncbi:MAG: site-specific integrase [Mediterranea sp.]|jgi:integrase|nr:site-specific integrase [Mediterranea sp.]